jgi:hypothetical protein
MGDLYHEKETIRKQKNKKKQGNSKSIASGTPLVERHKLFLANENVRFL